MTTAAALPKIEPGRPVLTHLNADTSWLISLPRPSAKDAKDVTATRSYYHIIVDPWLDGEYVFLSRWLIAMTHSSPGQYRTIKQVQNLILEIERASGTSAAEDDGRPDAVFVSHFLGDHWDRNSLEQIDPSVPFISVDAMVKEVKAWNHFQTVEAIPNIDLNSAEALWQAPAESILPDYVRIGLMPDGSGLYPELYLAHLIAFTSSEGGLTASGSKVESIFYTPHGIFPERLTNIDWATKHSDLLALFHGLNPAWSPKAVNLGVENGAKLVTLLKPKYWIPTHDEVLSFQGILGWFQTKPKKSFADADLEIDGTKPVCKDLENGETFVLA